MLIGIICAMESEARCFGQRRGLFLGGHDYVVTVCGPGRENAARAAHALILDGCTNLLSWGLAGGLDPDLKPGDAIVTDRVLTESGDALPADTALCTELLARVGSQAQSGALLTVAKPISSAREKTSLRERFGADAIEMESSAIAYVARSAKVAFVGVRCIVDPAGFNIPAAALAGLDDRGALRPLPALQALWQDRRQIQAMFEIYSHYRSACAKLRSLADALR